MTKTETVSVSLRSVLAAQLRDAAAVRRKTLAAIVSEALEAYLQGPAKTGESAPETLDNILAIAAASYAKQDEILATINARNERELARLKAINDNLSDISAAVDRGVGNANRT